MLELFGNAAITNLEMFQKLLEKARLRGVVSDMSIHFIQEVNGEELF
jgi:hypothetical protein